MKSWNLRNISHCSVNLSFCQHSNLVPSLSLKRDKKLENEFKIYVTKIENNWSSWKFQHNPSNRLRGVLITRYGHLLSDWLTFLQTRSNCRLAPPVKIETSNGRCGIILIYKMIHDVLVFPFPIMLSLVIMKFKFWFDHLVNVPVDASLQNCSDFITTF